MEHASAVSAAAKEKVDRLAAEEKLAKQAAKIEADMKTAAAASRRIEEMKAAAKEKASMIAAQKAAAREAERAANVEKTTRLANLAKAKITELLAQKEAMERESINMETQLVDIDNASFLSADGSDAHGSHSEISTQQRMVNWRVAASAPSSALLHRSLATSVSQSIAIESMVCTLFASYHH